jgi:uncharacterized protein DUF3237
MSSSLDEIPETLRTLRSRALFVIRLDVRPIEVIGSTPGGNRRVGIVTGGSFVGERLSGDVLDGGSDWQNVRRDGATTLDVRLILRTHDGCLIGMTYQGIRHGPAEVLESIAKGIPVDPAAYYFRINPMFETADPRYDWLNRVLAVGIGHRPPEGAIYSVFEVL